MPDGTVSAPALSVMAYVGDGTRTSWEINFAGGFISRSHVYAFTINANNVEVPTPLDWVSDAVVLVSPPVAPGVQLRIRRITPGETPIADFTDGSALTEASLDINARQAVFLAAEANDRYYANFASSIRVEGEQLSPLPKKSTLSGLLLSFDSNGDPALMDPAELGAFPPQAPADEAVIGIAANLIRTQTTVTTILGRLP